MDTHIGHTCYVIDLLNDISTNEISAVLKKYIEKRTAHVSLGNLEDWTLEFRASYTNGREPLVSKNRLGSFTSEKMKEVTVAIPIPTIDKVAWGVQNAQHIFKENHFDNLMRNFQPLEVDYRNFNNKTDYILACMKAGISISFQRGITINGKMIKFQILGR